MLDNTTTTPRIYVACLASYNSGILHGAWIDAQSDEEAMSEEVAAMLAKSPVSDAEEWMIHDYDDANKIISHLGETSDLGAVAEIMEAFEEISADYDESIVPLLIEWASDTVCEAYNWKSSIDDAFAGEWNDPEDYAADLCESCGYVNEMPEALRGYIDYRAMARDMALGGEIDFIDTSTGQHLQSYDDMRGRNCIALRNL